MKFEQERQGCLYLHASLQRRFFPNRLTNLHGALFHTIQCKDVTVLSVSLCLVTIGCWENIPFFAEPQPDISTSVCSSFLRQQSGFMPSEKRSFGVMKRLVSTVDSTLHHNTLKVFYFLVDPKHSNPFILCISRKSCR